MHTPINERFRIILPVALIAAITVCALGAAGISFYVRGQRMMEEQLKEKLRTAATAAVMQFDGEMLKKINSGSTMENSEELRNVVYRLHDLRTQIANVRFAYIMRRTEDPLMHAFIADADMALSDEELDENKNGILEEAEKAAEPGELYEWEGFPVLAEQAFMRPSVDENIGEDVWGPIISGYAPIKTKNGEVVATLGIDMAADEYKALSTSIFSPIALLLVLLAAISIAGGTVLGFWRSRANELQRLETERMGLLRLAFHQLGGPLTIISWSLEELEEDGPTSIQRTVENIHEGIRRLNGILKTLKEADIVHAGKIDYKPESVSLSTILEEVAAQSKIKLDERKQTINLSLDRSLTMNLDPKLIASVAQELITNAIDFSPNGAEIRVVSVRVGEEWAEFSVIDTGYGIPKKDQKRIFEEFTRGSNALKYKSDGNGLGMYIVKGIVEQAGGKVRLRSTEGKGTTVTVRLPVR
ncbi:MAG: HAMP domain-containing sensor histidine kinase [Candidatus Peribacteraceae bacterium]